jgi:RNA polymerase sigma-70 factor (ECF subfamily)
MVEAIAQRQDRNAFSGLFDYYAPRVKGYLMKLGLASAEAEEITQEVMVTVWRKAATFDRRQASVATWLFRIARNRRIDAFRRELRADYDQDDPVLQPEPEPAPSEAVEAQDREAAVAEAMAQLPPEQMELIRRAFYEGLSHREIAAATGLPLGTVKSRLRLAFEKLRGRLDAEL